MENVDFKDKFWPSSNDGFQPFIAEIKNQLSLISNIRAYLKKRCKLYEVFIKDLQKQIPKKEELIIESCQSYSTLFIASLESEIKKLTKNRSDGLHAIELLDKADQAYATFKENYQKQYSQLITESGALSSVNDNIGALVESYKSAKSSLTKFQEENHKDQYTADKPLKKIGKEISRSIQKREKIRLSFISLVENIIPPLKTLSTTILDLIDDFIHSWITIVIDLSIVSEDTNEIQKALNSLSTVGALEKMLSGLSSRGYAPRKIKFNPDSTEDLLILEDGTKADDVEFPSTKNRNLKKLNSTALIQTAKKSSESTENEKSVQNPEADKITILNEPHTFIPSSKNIIDVDVENIEVTNSKELSDDIDERPKLRPRKSLGNSVFYISSSPKPEEKANSQILDSDEVKDKDINLLDFSNESNDDAIHKLNIGIKANSSDPSLPKPSIQAPNSAPVIIPTSHPNQNLDNSIIIDTSSSLEDKNIISSSILGDSAKKAVSNHTNVENIADIYDICSEPIVLMRSSPNQFSKPSENLSTPFNVIGENSLFSSKSSDIFANRTHTSSQPKTIAPKDNPFSNSIDLSTKIYSQTSCTKEKILDKTDYSSLAENSASNRTDFFPDKNKNTSYSYNMFPIYENPYLESHQNVKSVDFLAARNDMKASSHSVKLFPKEYEPYDSSGNSQFNLSISNNSKKYSISFKINEELSCFTKQKMTKYSLNGSVTFSLSDEDVQTLASTSTLNFPKCSFSVIHDDKLTNKFSSANSLVEKTFKNEKSETIFNIDKTEFMLILDKFIKEHKSKHFRDIPLLNYEISSPTFFVKPYSITIEPTLMEEKKVTLSVSIICAPLDTWCTYYPEFSAVSKNSIVTLAANRIRSKSPLEVESVLPTNKYRWSPETNRLQWIIPELISYSKTSLSASNYQFKIIISSESKIDLDDESKILGVAITFNLDNTLVSSKHITISDTSMFYLDNTQKKLSSGPYLTEL